MALPLSSVTAGSVVWSSKDLGFDRLCVPTAQSRQDNCGSPERSYEALFPFHGMQVLGESHAGCYVVLEEQFPHCVLWVASGPQGLGEVFSSILNVSISDL